MLTDHRGAVFVEKLIALFPVLLTFFLGWELAEVGAASLVVQRASAAAGRAAMVVLPDDPRYYGEEPPDTYAGARRADVELAAGMVLSALPQLSENFEVDVSDPPDGFGEIDVTVRAPYECGAVGLICRAGGGLTLTSTTKHAYHGASYAYSAADGGGGVQVAGAAQALTAAKTPPPNKPGGGNSGNGGCGKPPVFKCDASGNFAYNNTLERAQNGPRPGKKQTGPSPLQQAALDRRCADRKLGKDKGANYAALQYECTQGGVTSQKTIPARSGEGQHAEIAAYEEFLSVKRAVRRDGGSCKLVAIYTEREPCSDCRDKLIRALQRGGEPNAASLGIVSYSYDYNISGSGNQQLGAANLEALKKRFGSNPCTGANQEIADKEKHGKLSAQELNAIRNAAEVYEALLAQEDMRRKATQAADAQHCPP
ncbi:MAG TPA: nucleic acid/nucleotide deaminase domain-containing protein [Polyangiales bacterium]|nr:nucleic acid/nucleotide deaminase domain-containing protein [Polyangiales bacterium]